MSVVVQPALDMHLYSALSHWDPPVKGVRVDPWVTATKSPIPELDIAPAGIAWRYYNGRHLLRSVGPGVFAHTYNI